jgi:hypothetical protein
MCIIDETLLPAECNNLSFLFQEIPQQNKHKISAIDTNFVLEVKNICVCVFVYVYIYIYVSDMQT